MMKSLFIFLLFAVVTTIFAEKVHVTLKNGPIIGERIVAQYRSVDRFLGIRYGQAPVGNLRFRRALPIVDKWTEPMEALEWGDSCTQMAEHPFSAINSTMKLSTKMSEDCLFLNVWTPNSDEQDETKLRPVIVWIHGGALLLGTPSMKWTEGETLASRADVVVVSINYRLSTLGFLYSDAVDEVKGNQGLWDQVLALGWVQENIRYFGGNPNMVTIMGESAGSWSVSLQILSPQSRNLFHNAIMMSGAAFNDRIVTDPKTSVEKWLFGIRKVGCATEHDTSITSEIIQCLKSMDAAHIDAIGYLTAEHPSRKFF